jgi:hypothetical protein
MTHNYDWIVSLNRIDRFIGGARRLRGRAGCALRTGLIGLGLACAIPAHAASPGSGNRLAGSTARASPLVTSARHDLRLLAERLRDPALRRATIDAVENPATCIRHRAHLDPAAAGAIVDRLVAAHLLGDPAGPPDAATRAALIDAVFPPVRDADGDCPHLPQPFYAAPGSDNAGHHRWPGGLAVHTAFNAQIALALADAHVHQTRLHLDRDALIAAPLWHDWAKTLVFQWHADGREFDEVRLGGQGTVDNHGQPGDSRTGAHHILGLAEAMARGLSPSQVLIQACAHAAPTAGQAYKVVNWLHAAALIARIDPVARGYLRVDPQGQLALGPWGAECLIHFQSDQNWVMEEIAADRSDSVLAALARGFGYDPADAARYRTAYRNVVLSQLGADHIALRNERGGLAAVAADLRRLRRRGII